MLYRFQNRRPHRSIWLEVAVARLQKDIADYRKEIKVSSVQSPAFPSQPTKRLLGAIACSNGWDDVTAALQLLSHLDGDALNVALLVPESKRVLPRVLVASLSEHYGSPGWLAEYKHHFEKAFRRPGEDPSIFAIELESLAR